MKRLTYQQISDAMQTCYGFTRETVMSQCNILDRDVFDQRFVIEYIPDSFALGCRDLLTGEVIFKECISAWLDLEWEENSLMM